MAVYNWSQTSATNATADPTVNYAEGQAPSSLNDSARAAMAAVAKYRDDIAGSILTTGTSTAYAVTSNSAFDTLAHLGGQAIAFAMHATNGATVTLNVDSLGAKPLRSATGVELPAGALIIGAVYAAVYNNSDGVFYLMGFYGAAFKNTTITGTLSATGAVTFSSTLAVASDFAVNSTMFTVAGASGNTVVAGTFGATGAGTFSSTLSATGNFAINTNKFTVTASSGNTAIAGTLAVTGLSTLTGGATSPAAILSSSASAGIGYSTGAGGTVTQGSSSGKSTAVTLNAICGQITMNNASLGNSIGASFSFNNSAIGANDIVLASISSGATAGGYLMVVDAISAGFARIIVRNFSGGSLSEAIVINFIVIKSAAS